jgi:hypothetical protein
MQTIQLVLSDAAYARRLKQLLSENGNWPVAIKETPSFHKGGVVVLDEKVLAALSSPPDYPDRVVLVTDNDPAILSHAWDLGIRSVVFHTDTATTVLLAIMSAYLRLPKTPQPVTRRVISPSSPSTLLNIDPTSISPRRD